MKIETILVSIPIIVIVITFLVNVYVYEFLDSFKKTAYAMVYFLLYLVGGLIAVKVYVSLDLFVLEGFGALVTTIILIHQVLLARYIKYLKKNV